MNIEALVGRAPAEDLLDISRPCEHAAILLMRETVDLVEFGGKMGLEPVPHNKEGALIWDVRQVATAAGQSVARSQTAGEFPLHTDASFEPMPPRFFMLQVLHPDRFGGGLQSFVSIENVLMGLQPGIRRQLATEKFRWRVPVEFQKNSIENELPILFDDEQASSIRYREECLVVRRSSSHYSLLNSLKAAVRQARAVRHRPSQNEIVLVDNWHLLHGRSEVRDPLRHLQRVRFK